MSHVIQMNESCHAYGYHLALRHLRCQLTVSTTQLPYWLYWFLRVHAGEGGSPCNGGSSSSVSGSMVFQQPGRYTHIPFLYVHHGHKCSIVPPLPALHPQILRLASRVRCTVHTVRPNSQGTGTPSRYLHRARVSAALSTSLCSATPVQAGASCS